MTQQSQTFWDTDLLDFLQWVYFLVEICKSRNNLEILTETQMRSFFFGIYAHVRKKNVIMTNLVLLLLILLGQRFQAANMFSCINSHIKADCLCRISRKARRKALISHL